VGRVVIHELCHHWREERFPHGTSHDPVFCRELARVDPVVRQAGRRECTKFVVATDLAKKNEAIKRRGQVPPSWKPEAGELVVTLEGRKYPVVWRPRGRQRWSPWQEYLSSRLISGFCKQFKPQDMPRVRVLDQAFGLGATDLGTFLRMLARSAPRYYADLVTWLNGPGRAMTAGRRKKAATGRPKARCRAVKKPATRRPAKRRTAPRKARSRRGSR
jgi:hypothetical protein